MTESFEYHALLKMIKHGKILVANIGDKKSLDLILELEEKLISSKETFGEDEEIYTKLLEIVEKIEQHRRGLT